MKTGQPFGTAGSELRQQNEVAIMFSGLSSADKNVLATLNGGLVACHEKQDAEGAIAYDCAIGLLCNRHSGSTSECVRLLLLVMKAVNMVDEAITKALPEEALVNANHQLVSASSLLLHIICTIAQVPETIDYETDSLLSIPIRSRIQLKIASLLDPEKLPTEEEIRDAVQLIVSAHGRLVPALKKFYEQKSIGN